MLDGNFPGRCGLFFRSSCNLVDLHGDIVYLGEYLLQCLSGADGIFGSLLDFRHTFFNSGNRSLCFFLDRLDHLADLAGGTGRAFGKGAHFIGNYSETATLLTGTGRLDSGIERQQVGLVCNVFNSADDLADLVGSVSPVLRRCLPCPLP